MKFRENHEEIIKIKNMSSDGKIPKGLLLEGGVAIKDGKIIIILIFIIRYFLKFFRLAIESFNTAKNADKCNEKRPDFPAKKI